MTSLPTVRRRIRWRVRSIPLAAAAVSLLGAASAATANARPADQSSKRAVVIVQLRRGVSLSEGRALVRALGGRVQETLPMIDALAADLSGAGAGQLRHDPLVKDVTVNASVHQQSTPTVDVSKLASTYDSAVNAPSVWNNDGLTGTGVGVGLIDTGIDGNLPDFQVSQRETHSRVIASAVVNPAATTASDGYGHGTDVAGIIAGNGLNRPSSDPRYGKYVGVAPGANLVSIKVGDEQGSATVLDVINGLIFAVAHQYDYNIRVLNLSLSSSVAESYKTDPLDAMVEWAWSRGIAIVVAAGNSGTAADAVSYAPANDPYVITVGGTDGKAPADWSSRGTTQDGFAKPDVYAPGAHMVSVLAPGSAFASMCSDCILGGAYIRASGTSFAAPVVSGAIADMLQQNPNLTPAHIKGALIASATSFTDRVAGTPVLQIQIDRALRTSATADQNLTPNTLAAPMLTNSQQATQFVSMLASLFVNPPANLNAPWARASWVCTYCAQLEASASAGTSTGTDTDTDAGTSVAVAPTRSSWRSSLFDRSSWRQATWSVASAN